MPSASAAWKRNHAQATATRRSGDLGISAVSETRKLAAILVADIVGYSRLAGADEDRILARLRTLRSDLIDPTIAVHHGRIVKRTGDGGIIEFRSVVEAVRCAIEVQSGLAERNTGLPPEKRIEYRVGIHLGDVVEEEDGDLMGDGVNIAARLEGVAKPGAICLSEQAYWQVKGRLDLKVIDLGATQLKNIAEPLRVYSVEVGVPAQPKSTPRSESTAGEKSLAGLTMPDKPSIAVLAFDNMSGDPDQEYFSDGIGEDIITSLSMNHGIFVIARSSSYAYKGQSTDVSRIARELGVRYVLEGSVRRAGNRVRITAQLIEAEHRTHIWAGRYDRELTDIFSVQDEITRSIVAAVAPEMLEAEMRRVRRKEPQALGAWECAMRAQWHLMRLTREDLAEADRLAAQSIALDRDATLGLNIDAFAHLNEVAQGWSASLGQSVFAAHQSASRAVALDSRDAVSQTALASCETLIGRPDDAIARLRIGIDLNPNLSWAHGNLGLALACLGRGDEALKPFDEALRLSPRDQSIFLWLYLKGFALFVAGGYQDAVDWAEKSLRENANVPGAYRLRAASLSELGRMDEAKAALADLLRVSPDATVAATRAQVPLKRAEDLERYVGALKRAGLRDS
jgi:adenylate cyclase